jgi:periplasmic protein TonB
VVGASPVPGPTPGQGQGGEGTGQGGGTGAGIGPGTGTVRARPIRQASVAELRALHPQQARGRSGRVAVSCQVQLDTRLDGCRVSSETPPGLGFGQAGIQAATRHYRFSPQVRNGREEVSPITIIVEFGRPPR